MKMSKPRMYPSFENRDFFLDAGECIAFYRKRAGMTQAQLAAAVGVNRSYISRIESVNRVQPFSLELLFDISRALNTPVHLFFMPLPKTDKK